MAAEELLLEIRGDPVLRDFCSTEFDAAAFASKVVALEGGPARGSDAPVADSDSGVKRTAEATSAAVSSRAETTLENISANISKIETAIRAHVLENEDDFLGSVGGVSELAGKCDTLWMGVRDLKRSVAKIKREVMEPYEGVRLRTLQLHHVQSAGRLAKRVLRLLAALRRLRAQESALGLPPSSSSSSAANGSISVSLARPGELRELAAAGQALREIEAILADPEVRGVAVAEKERRYVDSVATAVRRSAAEALAHGLSGAAPVEVASALQVFYNLSCLPERVKGCVARLVDTADARCGKALSMAALAELSGEAGSAGALSALPASSGATTTPQKGTGSGLPTNASPPGGSMAGMAASPVTGLSAKEQGAHALRQRRARLREHAEELAAALHDATLQAWSLQRVLAKKRDPSSHELFHDVVASDTGTGMTRGAFRAYWERLCAAVADNLRRALAATSQTGSGGSDGGAARATLLQLYPPLRQALLAMVRRLQDSARLLAGDGASGVAVGAGAAATAGTAAGSSGGRGNGAVGSGADAAAADGAKTWVPPQGTLGGAALVGLAIDSDSEDEGGGSNANGLLNAGGAVNGTAGTKLNDFSGVGNGAIALTEASISGLGERIVGGSNAMTGLVVGPEEREALLNALAPLRDNFLAQSLERLTLPVEQMFPRFEGYMAAVPSKHDLSSFVRAARAEMALATGDGGDPTLAPLLMRGVVKAVALLVSKAETLVSTDPAAYAFPLSLNSTSAADGAPTAIGSGVSGRAKLRGGPASGLGGGVSAPGSSAGGAGALSSWTPTPEQSHNMQLLELLCRLRESLLSLSVLPASAANGTAADGVGEEEAARAAERCRVLVREAVASLEEVALLQVLEPYLYGATAALETVIAAMHAENFGSGGGGGDGPSLFVSSLQGAVSDFSRDHLGRISRLKAPFADAALKDLAARLMLSYVSHAALVRPLEEAGKLRMTRDMSAVEEILSVVAPPLALGASYAELRAFRQLLFVDGSATGGAAAAAGGGQRAFLTEPCLASLRPSTVWHHLFAQAPHELSSPHVAAGKSEHAYVQWLLGGAAAADWRNRAAAAGDGAPSSTSKRAAAAIVVLPRKLGADVSYAAEAAAWAAVQQCLDGYHQRRSATGGAKMPTPTAVALLTEAGPVLLAGYEERVAASGKAQR